MSDEWCGTDGEEPCISRRGGPRQTPRRWLADGVVVGQVIAGIGLVFLLFYGFVWLAMESTYPRASEVGLTMGMYTLLFGGSLAGCLWLIGKAIARM